MKFEPVKKNSQGTSVIVLQTVLHCMQYLGADGKPLAIDGHCGKNTVYAINIFQKRMRAYGFECGTDGKNDGCFGEKCWNILLGE